MFITVIKEGVYKCIVLHALHIICYIYMPQHMHKYLLCLNGIYSGYKVWFVDCNWGSGKVLVPLGFSQSVKKVNPFYMTLNCYSLYGNETKLNNVFEYLFKTT